MGLQGIGKILILGGAFLFFLGLLLFFWLGKCQRGITDNKKSEPQFWSSLLNIAIQFLNNPYSSTSASG